MTEIVDLIFKTYGLIGLLLVAPVGSTIWLWLHIVKTRDEAGKQSAEHTKQLLTVTESHTKELKIVYSLLAEVQDKRVADAQGVVTKLITTITEQTAMNTETNLALERMGDFIALGQPSTKVLPPHPKGGKKEEP